MRHAVRAALFAGVVSLPAVAVAQVLEIGYDQGDSAPAEAARRLPGWSVEVRPDLGGRPRVLLLGSPGGRAASA